MYKCLDCGEISSVLKEIKIPHWEVDTKIYETFSVCPVCESRDLDDVKLCPACNEHYIGEFDDYCEECFGDVSAAVSQIAEQKKLSWEDAVDLVSAWIER